MTREEIEDAYYKGIPIQFRWISSGIEWKDCKPIYPPLNWDSCEYRINPNADSTITIPKPKFKEGDIVKHIIYKYKIQDYLYHPINKKYYYRFLGKDLGFLIAENELELVERR